MHIKPNPYIRYVSSRPQKYDLPAEAIHVSETDHQYRLIFAWGGEHSSYHSAKMGTSRREAMMYLVPPNSFCAIHVAGEPMQVVEISFRSHTDLCHAQCPQHKPKRKTSLEARDVGDITKARPRRSSPTTTELSVAPALAQWLDGLLCLMDYDEVDMQYFDNRLLELFLLLRRAYDPSEEHAFLRFYHCRLEGFRERIGSAYHPLMELSDLYKIGEDMKLNELAFKRSFAEEFGLSPREWLIEQRARCIYRELLTTDRPLKELSLSFGFCSVSHFGSFCKQVLGDTPLRLRRGEHREA